MDSQRATGGGGEAGARLTLHGLEPVERYAVFLTVLQRRPQHLVLLTTHRYVTLTRDTVTAGSQLQCVDILHTAYAHVY